MLLLQMNQQNLSLEQKNQIATELQTSYEGYTYFDQKLKTELDALITDIKKGIQNPQVILDFQNHIHQEHTRLNFGFDSLLYKELTTRTPVEKFYEHELLAETYEGLQQSNEQALRTVEALLVKIEELEIQLDKYYDAGLSWKANKKDLEARYQMWMNDTDA